YEQELARLRSSTDPIEVKQIERAGKIVLEPPGRPIDKPLQKNKVEGITKSYDSYTGDLKDTNEKIKKEVEKSLAWTVKSEEITGILNGKKDAAGKPVKDTVGIYTLLDEEKKAQDQARFEKEYLQPIWARALEQAEVF